MRQATAWVSTSQSAEYRRAVVAATAFFLLLCGYYVLRPVRDEMGVQTGVARLQWLFTGTFVFTLLMVPIFGWVVKRVPRLTWRRACTASSSPICSRSTPPSPPG